MSAYSLSHGPEFSACLSTLLIVSLPLTMAAAELSPTHADVAYGEGRELMDLYLTRNDAPAPVYLYGHQKGGSFKHVPQSAVRRCQAAGVSFISIEANDTDGIVGRGLVTKGPWLKAIDYLATHAEQYNLDAENLFLGGRSMGSIGSFPAALERWEQVRGIYSVQAVPRRGDQAAELVHRNAPPCYFAFKTAPGSNDHDPLHGVKVRRAYERHGIGNRFAMDIEVPVERWFDKLVEFVQANATRSRNDQP